MGIAVPMVRVPDRTYRTKVAGDEQKPPRYWDLHEYLPNQEKVEHKKRKSVYLGRSERIHPERYTRTQRHRFLPPSGEWPQEFEHWVQGIVWLQRLYRQHNPDAGLLPLDIGT